MHVFLSFLLLSCRAPRPCVGRHRRLLSSNSDPLPFARLMNILTDHHSFLIGSRETGVELKELQTLVDEAVPCNCSAEQMIEHFIKLPPPQNIFSGSLALIWDDEQISRVEAVRG